MYWLGHNMIHEELQFKNKLTPNSRGSENEVDYGATTSHSMQPRRRTQSHIKTIKKNSNGQQTVCDVVSVKCFLYFPGSVCV